ncbi:MAG: sensor histidine kinase [Clostridiales bacterium]|jgi:two-component system sensor histidine kinase DegS|nr:sensor histidine kinase [Clostridiales bacterium]
MYSEKVSDSDILKKFILNLIEEYEDKLSFTIGQKKEYMSDLSEIEALILGLSKKKEKNNNMFSPNSKDYNIDGYVKESEELKDKIEKALNEQKDLETIVLHLREIKNVLWDQESPILNTGINILDLQERDRQRIARDLHDSTVQNLTSLIHKIQLCLRLVDMDPVRTKLELGSMTNTLKAVINELREIIYNLKPMSLEDLGLLLTVERYANQLMMNHDIKVRISHNDEIDDILPVIKLSLFRLIQEACNNAIKHAESKNIDIKIYFKKNQVSVTVIDDGKGFDLDCIGDNAQKDYSGYGLSIMKERVYLLSGTMKLDSTINKGTIVTITVPIFKSKGEE